MKHSYSEVFSLGRWEPIPDCPGRHVLRDVSTSVSLCELLGAGVEIFEHYSFAARDRVFVACLVDGGVISYLRPSGAWVHTLGTSEGFVRKLKHLGIEQSSDGGKGGQPEA